MGFAFTTSWRYSARAGLTLEHSPEQELLFGFEILEAGAGSGCGRDVGKSSSVKCDEAAGSCP